LSKTKELEFGTDVGRIVNDTIVSSVLPLFPQVYSLTLQDCCISDLGLAAVGRIARQLQQIRLIRLDTITGSGITSLASSCPNLRNASLISVPNVANPFGLLQSCPHLATLTLNDCAALKDAGDLLCSMLTGTVSACALANVSLSGSQIGGPAVEALAKTCGANLRYLNLSNCGVTVDAVRSLCTHCPNIYWLSLEHIGVEFEAIGDSPLVSSLRSFAVSSGNLTKGDVRALRCMTGLTSLSLRRAPKDSLIEALSVDRPALAELDVLDVNVGGALPFLQLLNQYCPRLTSLRMSCAPTEAPAILSYIAPTFPRMLTISLSGRPEGLVAKDMRGGDLLAGMGEVRDLFIPRTAVTDAFLVPAFCVGSRLARALQRVDLSRSLITDGTIAAMAVTCPKLIGLNLRETKITNAALRAITWGSFAQSLEFLGLWNCSQIDNDGVRLLLPSEGHGCPALRHLDVSGCSRVRGETIFAIATECPNLGKLGVFECRMVDAQTLLALKRLRPTLAIS